MCFLQTWMSVLLTAPCGRSLPRRLILGCVPWRRTTPLPAFTAECRPECVLFSGVHSTLPKPQSPPPRMSWTQLAASLVLCAKGFHGSFLLNPLCFLTAERPPSSATVGFLKGPPLKIRRRRFAIPTGWLLRRHCGAIELHPPGRDAHLPVCTLIPTLNIPAAPERWILTHQNAVFSLCTTKKTQLCNWERDVSALTQPRACTRWIFPRSPWESRAPGGWSSPSSAGQWSQAEKCHVS